MTDIDALSVENDSNPKVSRTRWLVTVLLLLSATGVTIAALHWYQPIRELLDGYLGVETVPEKTLESEDVSLREEVSGEPTVFVHREDSIEPDGTQQDLSELQDLYDIQVEGEPITITARDPLSVRNPFEDARFELQFALLVVQGSRDLALASDALQRVQSIANAHRMNSSFIDAVDRALVDIEQLRKMDIGSIQARLDELSKMIVSLRRFGTVNRLVGDPDTTFRVSEQPETQSFWGELIDGISSVYQIRRIDRTPLVENDHRAETESELRLLLMLERARRDIRMYDADSFRESLSEALATLDAVRPSNSNEHMLVRTELLELIDVELTSPITAIAHALEILSNESSTRTTNSSVSVP